MGKQDKSSFSVTCNLLSQYLKQNGSFADLMAKGSSHRPPTPMKLFPGAVVPDEQSKETQISEQKAPKSMDLFPQQSGFGLSHSANQSHLGNSPLTIFYGGKVLVFDNFPAEKARDLMQMARTQTAAAVKPATSSIPASNPQANTSEMPIARRASLHRFLEKRKERIIAKAPYQVNGSPASMIKPEDKKSWLGLAPQLSDEDRKFEYRR
ncbi:putative transcription factor TIFY family [Dioscorea sansibarensis]